MLFFEFPRQVEICQTISPQKDATISFFINKPKGKLKSVAILFSGGGSNINLDTKKGPEKKNNFLGRPRKFYANGGILAITPDVSTDLGELWDKRDSLEHQQDIAALIKFI